ncbi:MAG TPA: cation-transporting P-type ATPase [Candidatus Saccharimonadales bacterium]|nr:cation-transporting P-type ATPase [Candidatus Saccharimonadales bacterium]
MDDVRKIHYYRLSADQVLKEIKTNRDGLSQQEVAARLQQYGNNTLAIKRKDSALLTYLRQFRDLMILLLLASSAISLFLGDSRTAIVLFALVILNTTIGYLQEYKAGKVMESLERLVVSEATVVRGGKRISVATSEVTLGDIVYIEEGNAVPADLRIIEEDELTTNDFALTGESNPSRKFVHAIESDVPLANRHNLAFMGTTVATGRAYGVVISTGMHTELGRIANLSQGIDSETSPLQKEMNNIATRVTQGTMILCLILLPIAIKTGLPFKDAFLFAIGIACSIVPNGLPAAISTSLAGAAGKLARARALVKKLSSVESLGATSVICTDKTGTLTKNQMTVEQIMIGRTTYIVTGKGYEPTGTFLDHKNDPIPKDEVAKLELFFNTAVMASNARVSAPDDEHATWYCVGDPTEGALITLGYKSGLHIERLDHSYPEIKEYAFDSARKRMSSVRTYGDKKELHIFVKGAPESVLDHCDRIWESGKIRKLTKADRTFILKHNEQLATEAMRNLGFAYRILNGHSKKDLPSMEKAESSLVWLGMASMIDPLRAQVPNAMEAARKARIKVSIITGDHAITAKAIAVRAKLTADPKDIIVVSGEELQKLSDTKVRQLGLRGGVIFSRVAPEDKLRIVKLIQQSGHVVAVTGDGINDAPALKRADIGVAMGQTGTDVAKQSAEIILLDDSFTTLVGTVQEGRVIFQNIKKAAICCFTGNAAELMVNLFSLAAATALHIPLALTVIQILAIDVIAELFPVAALGGDKADSQVMSERPRNPKHHILNPRSTLDFLWCGTLIGGLAFLNYLWFFDRYGIDPINLAADSPIHLQATSLTYLTLILCLLVNVLQRRSQNGLFTRYQLHNKALWYAMGLSLFSIVNIIYNPWIAPYFHSAPLGFIDWLTALGATAIFIAVREFQRHNKKHHRKVVLELHSKVRAKTAKA